MSEADVTTLSARLAAAMREGGGAVNAAVNDALRQADEWNGAGRADAAAAVLETLAAAGLGAQVRRSLAMCRFIQGQDAAAAELAAAEPAGSGSTLVEGLRGALAAEADYRRRNDALVGAVVIPARNAAAWIGETLDSVADSIRYYRRKTGRAAAAFRIVAVDDASTDDTARRIDEWMGRCDAAETLLIRNSVNRGAGYSRNLGARNADGAHLWFLDSDDVFFEPHLFVGAWGLENQPQAGFVRSGMHFQGIDDQVTRGWRNASEATYPCNICIRLECHRLTGGFPEEGPFCPYGPEDVGYSRFIAATFLCARTTQQTVRYTIRDGNVGHSLKERLQSGGEVGVGPINAKDVAVELFIRRRLQRLAALRGDRDWRGPPILSDGTPRAVSFVAPV